MDEFLNRIESLSPKQLALLALQLNDELEAERSRQREPLAIVGMGCRFAGGVSDPDTFWRLLDAGRDAIGEVPGNRWDMEPWFDPDPDAPARISAREGGFLNDVSGFDAAFFGISPREALTMDPQQRLLLEVAWEALENAGLSPERLAGSPTGVFVGLCNSDYFQRLMQRGPETIDAYLASGNAPSVAAGRIAYCLGLQGPALAIDTACSSSLVALQLACRSLRSGETDVALAGGVNVICTPETSIALSKAHMLAPDGRCKTFDASADGFARAEGCGILVLKRLSDAQAHGDHVLAVIRGIATNQDGRSSGLTAPNGPSQEAVIRAALADGAVEAPDVDYVEAHGTGTQLGDPIEVRALAGALGAGRSPERPLLIGSVKTNIGHAEAAAGIAGVIKVVLALQNNRIPAHLHFTNPSPQIAWADYPVRVTAEPVAWPRGQGVRRAGVSSFGFSGTNAHVIIEEAPSPEPCGAVARPLHVIPVSAATESARAKLAGAYADVLADQDTDLGCFAHTAATGRSHLTERAAIVASSREAAREALQAIAEGEPHPAVQRGRAIPGRAPDVAFLFAGQGAQYAGMARQLYESSDVFAEVIDRCDALLGPDDRGQTLTSVLWRSGEGDGALDETAWTQPSLFAVQYGIAALWRSWGVEPAAVIGHSAGEYAAACVAGVYALEDGLRLVAERGRLMQSLPHGGGMAALFTSPDAVERAIAPFGGRIAIAAINAVDNVVISGASDAIEEVLANFEREEIRGRRLKISVAAHSSCVDPILDRMQALAASVPMRRPQIPVAWNLTGGRALANGAAPDALYWRRHLREPVRFAEAVSTLYESGCRVFLEIGPHPTLLALAQRTLPESEIQLLTSLRRGHDDWEELLASVSALYTMGAPIDWESFDRPYGFERLALPTYPFERRTFWVTPTTDPVLRRYPERAGNPIAGSRLATAEVIFESVLSPESRAYLADHRVGGRVLAPGPLFLETAWACAREALGADAAQAIEDFVVREPLAIEGDVSVQVSLDSEAAETRFRIHSRSEDGTWRLHASGRLTPNEVEAGPALDLAAARSRHPETVDCDGFYRRLRSLGIDFGPSFRLLQEACRSDRAVLARATLPQVLEADPVALAHPALLDAALQALGMAVPDSREPDSLYLLGGIARVGLTHRMPNSLWIHAELDETGEPSPASWSGRVTLFDERGGRLGILEGVRLARAAPHRPAKAQVRSDDDLHYAVEWEPVNIAARSLSVDVGRLQADVARDLAARADACGLAGYDELLPELDRLSVTAILQALGDLGFDPTPGRRFALSTEAEALGVVPAHRQLFERMLGILVEERMHLRIDAGVHEIRTHEPAVDFERACRMALTRFGVDQGELAMLSRCAGRLAGVLRGDQDPLHLLFPNGSLAEARKLYVESPSARTYNGSLARVLEQVVASRPASQALKVLEIGAGTGGTTSFILPALRADRTEYTFTDLSPLFLSRAEEQFAAYPFLRTNLLNVELDPASQGFARGSYDIVVAANVLHAAADLRQAVRHARDLLAPGGLLLLLEGTVPERWVDLTFGMTSGWWRFTDRTLRPSYPLIDAAAWEKLLREEGFDFAQSFHARNGSRGGSQQALVVARQRPEPRRWALVGNDPVGTALAESLVARGDDVALHRVDAECADLESRTLVYLGALTLAARDRDDVSAAPEAANLACDAPLKWLARAASSLAAGPVYVVTRGAQAAQAAMTPGARWQAPAWGVGRVFALEHPSLWGGLVDLPPYGNVETDAHALMTLLDSDGSEDQVALRAGGWHAARLVRSPAPAPVPARFRSDRTYLITGGFGGLGLLVGRWMAENGARHLALLGRRPDAGSEGVSAIESLGARVTVLAGDVADEATMRALLQAMEANAPRLGGIVHAAADLGTAPILDVTSDAVAAMLRPKLDGTLVLETLAREQDAEFLVLFSSTTALLGASGFAHYAAANQFLDATAQTAEAQGPRVLAINWGTWEAMRLADAKSQRSFVQSGLEPMRAEQALHALANLLGASEPQGIVAAIDWSALKPLHEARRTRPFLSRIEAPPTTSSKPAAVSEGLAERLQNATGETRKDVLDGFVRMQVAAVLDLAPDDLPGDVGLFELGMDSLMSVELKRNLETGVGRTLPSTLTFNYPNVDALTGFLLRLFGSERPSPELPPSPEPVAPPAGDIADLDDDEVEARLLARLEGVR